ncbi:MAG TPA: OmpA family protein [Tepidisphaeraceae bacterium]|nr:OmpA family protein [Tepidisphaeraceae bacterium]
MKLSRDQAVEQLNQAETDAKSARSQSDAYKAQLEQIANSGNTTQAMLSNYSQQVAQLQAQNAAITQKYEDVLNRPPQVVEMGERALPPDLSNRLTEFANENPDIVTFDAARGVVKFKSDVTFGSGSTDLNERAVDTLQRFSSILNSPEAVGYELMVAGHTDNQRVTRSSTINAGNFDNWYLSAHRAISVAAELVKNGVNRGRLGVAGYADQQPIASNATEAGRAQNRRVEIVILPTHPRSRSMASAGGGERSTQRIAPRPLDKDSYSSTNERTALSK